MSAITPQQMIEHMLEALNNAVKDYPEEEQEATKARLLDAFSAAMFKGPTPTAWVTAGNNTVPVVIPYRPTDLKGLKVRQECAICGRSGVTGYVCYHNNCPTKVSC